MNESHIQHAIHFVEDEIFNLVQVDVSLPHQIEQSPGRRNEDINTTLHCFDLSSLAYTTENDSVKNAEEFAVDLDALPNLRGELPGRSENQGARRALFRTPTTLRKTFQKRKSKGCRFPCSGLGSSDQIFSLEQMWDRLLLNGRRNGITRFFDRPLQFRNQFGEHAFQFCRIRTGIISAARPRRMVRSHMFFAPGNRYSLPIGLWNREVLK